MCTSDLDIIRTLAAGHGEGVAVFVAHPDDEVIMSGGFLSSAPNTLVIHATDGAPRDEGHVQRRGFKSIEEYRGTRSIELEAVLRIAGITRHIGFDVPDLQGPFNLTHLATQLADACMENMICVIFTHAYEGGHPDHDACAFAAHAAVQLVKRAGHELHIAEAPVYRPSRDGKSNVRQRFLPDSNATIVETTLSPKQRAAKHRMFLAHKS